MGLLDRLRGQRSAPVRRAGRSERLAAEHALVATYADEAALRLRYDVDPAELPTGRALLDDGDRRRHARLAVAAVEQIATRPHRASASMTWPGGDDDIPVYTHAGAPESATQDALRALARALMRRRLPFEEEDLKAMLVAAAAGDGDPFRFPLPQVLTAVKRHVQEHGAWPLRDELQALRTALERRTRGGSYAEERKALDRLRELLGDEGDGKLPLPRREQWAKAVLADLRAVADEGERRAWEQLVRHAASLSGPQPSARWRTQAGRLAGVLPPDALDARLGRWLEAGLEGEVIEDASGDALRGLLWIAVEGSGERLVQQVAALTASAATKVPGYGPRAPKVANAGFGALAAAPGDAGIAALTGIRRRLRHPSLRTRLEGAIEAAAERAGIDPDELEERAVPAEPATKRERTEALRAQRARLERLLATERVWDGAAWRSRYLEHPVLSELGRRLLWDVGGDAVAWDGAALVTRAGSPRPVADDDEVRLWHPIGRAADEIRGWRAWLEEHEVTQPFKQAHREVYLLTPAEREAGTASARFGGHVLRQHQLRELCRARGWRYELQGAWDSWNAPELELPTWGLRASLDVEPYAEAEQTEAAVFRFVTTGHVTFARGDAPVELADVPPRAFSEAMRDVDLFVGVAGIAADPQWPARAELGGELHGYWHETAFGDLGESARTRRETLERLVPKLAIADRCTVEDRFLHVRGDRFSYRIHLGSANVLVEPGSRYLCIVPAARRTPAARFLPFEGDQVLALVLSKAFLLAKDTAIEDERSSRSSPRARDEPGPRRAARGPAAGAGRTGPPAAPRAARSRPRAGPPPTSPGPPRGRTPRTPPRMRRARRGSGATARRPGRRRP